jgi:hypothetical protein
MDSGCSADTDGLSLGLDHGHDALLPSGVGRDVTPIAKEPDRERRLWDATSELLNQALSGR